MPFTLLPKGYSDEREQKKLDAIRKFIHYRTRGADGKPAGKYYAADIEDYPTEDGERYELNYLEVEHLLKTGTFRRIKKETTADRGATREPGIHRPGKRPGIHPRRGKIHHRMP
jgi:hypothetical protein